MAKFKNISDQQFGNVLALSYHHTNKKGDAVWECRCLKCNNVFYPLGSSLRKGGSNQCLSCAKKARHYTAVKKYQSFIGTTVNNRKLIKLLDTKGKYLCRCLLCKKEYISTYGSIKASFGCKCVNFGNKSGLKHGYSRTPFYKCWIAIKDRCFNETCKRYNCYGGRGIKICDEWLDFNKFKEDMLASYNSFKELYPSTKPTIDRVNVDGDYCKKNCRWLSRTENNKNTRRSKLKKSC